MAPPSFKPAAREVDNWRGQAALALDLAPEAALTALGGEDPRGTTRCVRLNNYWCIKRAGWAGEIAADAEGHVAFASAREGAAVAAILLRRYYVDLKLHSARAIVSRWAPAQCGLVARAPAPRPRIAAAGRAAPPRRAVNPLANVTLGGIAPHGIGNTLRARWLASRGRGVVMARASRGPRVARAAPAIPRALVPRYGVGLMETPAIMVGPGAPVSDAGTAARPREPVRLANLSAGIQPWAGVPLGPAPGTSGNAAPPTPRALPPVTSCAPDMVRIANYAAKTAQGVAAGPDDDLALFDADGLPTENLAKVMFNMASVEIGPLRASREVVEAGVAAARAARKGP